MCWQARGRHAVQAEFRIDHGHPQAPGLLARHLVRLLRRFPASERGFTVVCIGTDRSTGDALGPLVGQSLAEELVPGVTVFGTLDDPVHALNMDRVTGFLAGRGEAEPVLAVDACLGDPETEGMVTAGLGPLYPGAGVGKELPAVGHVFVTGTVNVSGLLERVVLQNTRRSLVVRMARLIARSIAAAAAKVVRTPLPRPPAGPRAVPTADPPRPCELRFSAAAGAPPRRPPGAP